jgi:Acetyltransferase (GNAT) domain
MSEVGTARLLLRRWQDDDLERLVALYGAIDKHTGRWLGQVGLNELPRSPGPHRVEVGWDLHPSVRGQGLATEGAQAALRSPEGARAAIS